MEQNKYFTPDIEDLHIGYECEIGNPFTLHDSCRKWSKSKPIRWDTLSFIATAMIPEHLIYVRTKYLDKSDIESLGWVHTGGQIVVGGRQEYEKRGLVLYHLPRHQSLFIAKAINPDLMDVFFEKLFDGQCKSINELRIIHKLLQIN